MPTTVISSSMEAVAKVGQLATANEDIYMAVSDATNLYPTTTAEHLIQVVG